MTARRLEIFIIVVIIAVIGVVYAMTRQPVLAPVTEQSTQNQNQNSTQQVPTTIIEYKGQDGKNAMELLRASHQVEVKSYSFGDLVTGIDGVSPDSTHFWAMYVNNTFSQVGAAEVITKSSDTIRWQIEEIKY
jgi:hypothetical protein